MLLAGRGVGVLSEADEEEGGLLVDGGEEDGGSLVCGGGEDELLADGEEDGGSLVCAGGEDELLAGGEEDGGSLVCDGGEEDGLLGDSTENGLAALGESDEDGVVVPGGAVVAGAVVAEEPSEDVLVDGGDEVPPGSGKKMAPGRQEKEWQNQRDTYLAIAQYSKRYYPAHYPAHSTEQDRSGDGYVGCGEGGDDEYDERRVGHERPEGEKTRGRKEKRKAKPCTVESYCIRNGLKECGSTESAGRRRESDNSRRAAKRGGQGQ